MTDLAFRSALELAAAIRRKEVSALELTDHYIARIERYDAGINAVVVRDFERARAAARAADAALARGTVLGPLHGLPMTIKESFNLAGTPTTWGVPSFKDNIATEDAEYVRKLKGAGAHFLGKTNVPLNLGDFQSFNEIYGTTNNPWNHARIPGGSSGGSAAALAAGLTGLEAGSDIGGSIRNPAHFCGVYGHKPTWGIVPPQGQVLPGMIAPPDIAVVGPMARSAEDLALSMDLVAGADPDNVAGWKLELPRPVKQSLKDYRIAVWSTDERMPVSREIADRALQLGDTLRRLGATVSDTARPDIDLDHSSRVYQGLLWGVMGAGLTEEQKAEYRAIVGTLAADDHSAPASAARGSIQAHATWLRSNNDRFALRAAWRRFFTEWDILICPQMPTTAFAHDHGDYMGRTIRVDNANFQYMQQLFWAGQITVAHLPSTVFPTGPSSEGLPIGLQAVGAEFNDYVTIDFARLLAKEIGGFVPPPGY